MSNHDSRRAAAPVIDALRTPVGDVMQGRLSRHHNPDEILRRADLPHSITTAIATILRRSRLWRSERADVAFELATHFRDGLDAGRTSDELLSEFGSPRTAATLIRRAKRRNRPGIWRLWAAAWAAVGWGLLLLLGVYTFLFARYLLMKPTISRNYLAEMNAPINAIPERDRAWPLYRQAYLSLTPIMEQTPASFELPEDGMPPRLIDSLGAWDLPIESLAQARDYLTLNAPALDTIRAAALRPSLGAVATTAFDLDVIRHSHRLGSAPEADLSNHRTTEDPDAPLVQVIGNELTPIRLLARMLATDTRLAADAGDADRATANITSMYRICGHYRQRGWLIGDLIAMAVHALALDTTSHLLTDHPDLLSDEQVTLLAHAAASIGAGEPIVRFDAERVQFDDFLQRIYSDNGHGNGVLTRDGLLTMQQFTADFGATNPVPFEEDGAHLVLGPVVAAVVADRASTRRMYNSFIDAIEIRARQPLWERDISQSVDARVDRFYQSEFSRARYPVVAMMVPALEHATTQADRLKMRRDATLTLIALEMHRRRTGAYPAALEDLSPTLLPITPRDLMTGEPLRYMLRDGKPVIYSRGADKDDDGGRAVDGTDPYFKANFVQPDNHVNALMNARGTHPAFDGDWILWPPAPTQ